MWVSIKMDALDVHSACHICTASLKSLQSIPLPAKTLLSVAAEPPEPSHRSWYSYIHIVRASDDTM